MLFVPHSNSAHSQAAQYCLFFSFLGRIRQQRICLFNRKHGSCCYLDNGKWIIPFHLYPYCIMLPSQLIYTRNRCILRIAPAKSKKRKCPRHNDKLSCRAEPANPNRLIQLAPAELTWPLRGQLQRHVMRQSFSSSNISRMPVGSDFSLVSMPLVIS